MPRFDAEVLLKNEANTVELELDDEPGPVIVPIHRGERAFRWLNNFRTEPRFELAPIEDHTDTNGPDRAA